MAKQLPMHFYRSPAPFSRLQLAAGQTEIAGVHPGPSKTFSLLLIGLVVAAILRQESGNVTCIAIAFRQSAYFEIRFPKPLRTVKAWRATRRNSQSTYAVD
jgi:hypothetical protein